MGVFGCGMGGLKAGSRRAASIRWRRWSMAPRVVKRAFSCCWLMLRSAIVAAEDPVGYPSKSCRALNYDKKRYGTAGN